jgi:hypothetical protein
MRVVVAQTQDRTREKITQLLAKGLVGPILIVNYRRRSIRAPVRDDTKSYLLVEIDRGEMAVR